MAAPGTAPVQVSHESLSAASPAEDLLTVILQAYPHASDVIFSPGRSFQVHVNGEFMPLEIPGFPPLTADDTRRIASDLIGNNKAAINMLREQGYCDISYALPRMARFRVNVFIQRGSCAVVMRVIPTVIPDFKTLALPPQLKEIAELHDGMVLIAGPRGCGKSSTLAALLDQMNESVMRHIITIEDPIEFLHNHKRSTIHQRELHSDTPNFALALRAALRQAPKVIFVGEMRDRETIEMVLEAADMGLIVFSTLNTVDPSKTVERIVGAYAPEEQKTVRERLAKTFRFIISQRLIPRADGSGRVPVFEIVKSNGRTRECIEKGEHDGKTLLDAIKAGEADGMQSFDSEIAKLVRNGLVDLETGVSFASNAAVLGQELAK